MVEMLSAPPVSRNVLRMPVSAAACCGARSSAALFEAGRGQAGAEPADGQDVRQ